MRKHTHVAAGFVVGFLAGGLILAVRSDDPKPANDTPPHDAVADFQTPRNVPSDRPEQKKSRHDRSNVFDARRAPAVSPALDRQPEKGRFLGFDFGRDPLDAKHPMQTLADIMNEDIAGKAKVMALQHHLLESRYDLHPHFDREVTMSRGKPLSTS
jgi:hypothetical protein